MWATSCYVLGSQKNKMRKRTECQHSSFSASWLWIQSDLLHQSWCHDLPAMTDCPLKPTSQRKRFLPSTVIVTHTVTAREMWEIQSCTWDSLSKLGTSWSLSQSLRECPVNTWLGKSLSEVTCEHVNGKGYVPRSCVVELLESHWNYCSWLMMTPVHCNMSLPIRLFEQWRANW